MIEVVKKISKSDHSVTAVSVAWGRKDGMLVYRGILTAFCQPGSQALSPSLQLNDKEGKRERAWDRGWHSVRLICSRNSHLHSQCIPPTLSISPKHAPPSWPTPGLKPGVLWRCKNLTKSVADTAKGYFLGR